MKRSGLTSGSETQCRYSELLLIKLAKPVEGFLEVVSASEGAVKVLTTMVSAHMSAISDRVEELSSWCDQRALGRKIEELSGQLVSLAQRSRQ